MKKEKGITLIELIIIIALFSVMMVGVLVFSTQAKTRKEVDLESDKIKSVVREAQNYALTGRGIVQSGCEFFEVSWSTGGSNYFVKSMNSASGDYTGCSINESYQLEYNVSFSNSGRIVFKVPHGNIITSSSVGIKKTDDVESCVKITSEGLVENKRDSC